MYAIIPFSVSLDDKKGVLFVSGVPSILELNVSFFLILLLNAKIIRGGNEGRYIAFLYKLVIIWS